MAENIQKVYPKGTWYNDSQEKRFERVQIVLNRYLSGEYDIRDVNWFIKNAIINRIYISEEVKQMGDIAWTNKQNSRLKDILDIIDKNGSAPDEYLDIRKYCKGVRFEHIVPGILAINRLIDLQREGNLTFRKFQNIRSKLNICIVTKDEDKRLSSLYRQKMPDGVNWETGNEFGRYDAAKIKIYGRP